MYIESDSERQSKMEAAKDRVFTREDEQIL